MKLPRDLAGDELASILCRHLGYRHVHQEGSHIVIETSEPEPQRLEFDLAVCRPAQRHQPRATSEANLNPLTTK
jgi:hypothetical protein